jgi:hypothetical protein
MDLRLCQMFKWVVLSPDELSRRLKFNALRAGYAAPGSHLEEKEKKNRPLIYLIKKPAGVLDGCSTLSQRFLYTPPVFFTGNELLPLQSQERHTYQN